MRILLSIKPIFVNEIMAGTKLYEFRKQLFKHTEIRTIVVYASSPVCKIVGEIEIEDILEDRPDVIWEKTKCRSGVSSSFFFDYFKDKEIAYAIKIARFTKYAIPLSLEDLKKGMKPPQSFCYID